MDGSRAKKIATLLYNDVITGEGIAPPQSYAEMIDVVLATGAQVVSCQSAPRGFTGVQIGDILYVNTSPYMPDHDSMHILAHEWCHWLRRRSQDQFRQVRLYQGRDRIEEREGEESIARAFERLF